MAPPPPKTPTPAEPNPAILPLSESARGPKQSVDPTATMSWMRVAHPEHATPVEQVIMNNLTFIATQMQTITAAKEASINAEYRVVKRKKHHSSTDACEGSSDKKQKTSKELTTPRSSVAILMDEWEGLLRDGYNVFISQGNKGHITPVKGAHSAADSFVNHLKSMFHADDEVHPAKGLIEGLGKQSGLDLYINLGRLYKASKKDNKTVDGGEEEDNEEEQLVEDSD